ncbi:MAG TPA: OmpA family protein, partial [Polyangiaceae bacterium]|nr:OmpA family protein [Polyangiaceae bacterium]
AVTRVDFAASPAIWFPSATEGYAGDGSVRGGGTLIVAGDSPRLYWAASGGVRSRPAAELPGLVPTRVGHEVVAGMAAGFYPEPGRQLALGTEATASFTVGGGARFLDPRATVAHFFLTSHWRVLGGPFELGAALGPGVGRGAGSSDFRALFLFGYAPEEPEPPPDADDDGIPDANDACVDLPGVKSRDPVLHGCPRPEIDRDGDAIPDRYDACPREPGEPTGDLRTHGCPIEEPEPQPAPKQPPKAEVVEQQIKISQRVEFAVNTAELLAESEGILREVARALEEHPDIELVEVQGHTDDTGTPERNRKLGQERAEAVVDWLAAHGVVRERLVPKGYGTERPLADNTSVEGRAQNRRVEFHILKRTEGAP